MNLKVIITGVTGMVGEGVLHECLLDKRVSEVLVISRRPSNVFHPKLKEVIHKDFFNLQTIEHNLKGYDACYFCLGVTSIGKKEDEYSQMTYALTMHFAQTLVRQNPSMIFCYVSGMGTDSSEKGKQMWARVKGKTENDLMKLGFKNVYAFRPGFIQPTKGLKNTLSFYKYINWMFPLLKKVASKYVSTLKEVGVAMINVTLHGYPKNIIEVKDIVALAAYEK